MEKTIWVNGNEFILIEAENLSLTDNVMQYKVQTHIEIDTKELISEAIRNRVKNFYLPKCDPSFTEDGKSICFMPGKKSAVGKSFDWWNVTAKSFCPEHSSRLGTNLEYGAFLGVLIKKLIEEGKSVEWAWNAVCKDSRELGNYYNSENAKQDFEHTGSRCICSFCDLANVYKMLADCDNNGFWYASGCCLVNGTYSPVANLDMGMWRSCDDSTAVGWIVLEK